ncbi:MAG TPA: TetR/AcrR family transcriptional regulator [Acidobacteriaceae bacterium]|jgi:AcrR family transcriptional regulator|nr:TetR/AcrR family transcriptional regulator [Acidobacteriaceae bacterium]
MGNREALLIGAKRCLLEKGYERTTARDIAAAADVSLAAIGYHFRSKEALLTEALILAIGDWEKEFRRALDSAVRADADPAKRFETIWTQLIKTFETHRPLWAANFELFVQIDRMPEIRRVLGDSFQQARAGLASLFLNKDESAIDEKTVRTAGGFYHALLSGLISQFLIDPEQALSARDLTDALRTITAGMPLKHEPSKRKPKHRQKKPKKR